MNVAIDLYANNTVQAGGSGAADQYQKKTTQAGAATELLWTSLNGGNTGIRYYVEFTDA